VNECDPLVIGGAAREFVLSGRLDNLASSFCALKAMLAAGGDGRGSLKVGRDGKLRWNCLKLLCHSSTPDFLPKV